MKIWSISPQPRHARIQSMGIQTRIRRKDEFLITFGEAMGGYIDVLRCRGYCLWILPSPAKCNEFIAYFQEYMRGRIHRYDYSISGNTENDEQHCAYAPETIPGDGEDTYEGRIRALSVAETVRIV